MSFLSSTGSVIWITLKRIRDQWQNLRGYLKLAAPCWFAITVTLVLSLATLHPQTIDALAALAEEHRLISRRNLALILTLLTFSITVWYICRTLLYVSYSRKPIILTGGRRQVVTWLPRVMGVLPIVAVSGAYLVSRQLTFVIFYVVLAVIFIFTLHLRRKGIARLEQKKKPTADDATASATLGEMRPSLPRLTRYVIYGALVTVALVLFLVWALPVRVPQMVGPLGVIYIAGAVWTIVVSTLLIYPSRRYRLPSLLAIMIILAVLFGALNDNHGVAPIPDSLSMVDQRSSLSTHFTRWLQHRGVDPAGQGHAPYPVFVVTAEGGGIRAAYWTASVLNEITNQASDFPCYLYAISGVSGGSLGAATFAARVADVMSVDDDPDRFCQGRKIQRQEREDDSDSKKEAGMGVLGSESNGLRVELEALGQDFLSPVLAGMMFPDLVQRFLPFPLGIDRAWYLDRAWETAWNRAWITERTRNDLAEKFSTQGRTSEDYNRFSQSFLQLWHKKHAWVTPSLFFNATRVETGQRVIISNIQVVDADSEETGRVNNFGFAYDLLDRMGGSVKLSEGARLSASFTYVTPAATIKDRSTGNTTRVVDGGYFENSGAVTAHEMVNVLREACRVPNNQCEVHVLIISNDVKNPNAGEKEDDLPDFSYCKPNGNTGNLVQSKMVMSTEEEVSIDAHTFFAETMSPLRALFATRTARGYLAEEQLRSDDPCLSYRAQLRPKGDRTIPLGWILSDAMQEEIESQAKSDAAVARIAEIVREDQKDIHPGGEN